MPAPGGTVRQNRYTEAVLAGQQAGEDRPTTRREFMGIKVDFRLAARPFAWV